VLGLTEAHADDSCRTTPPLTLTWQSTGASPTLALSGAETQEVLDLFVRFRFAHLTHEFYMGPVTVEPGQVALVTVPLVPESKLDPLASTYVVSLDVEVGSRAAPRLYVSWKSAAPVAWSAVELQTHAPRGVLDPALDQTYASRPSPPAWVEPPIFQPGLPVFEDDGAGVSP
jgi:hypothetical protein